MNRAASAPRGLVFTIRGGWGWATFGTLVAWFTSSGAYAIEGAAVGVLSFGVMALALDRRWFPGLLIGPSTWSYVFHGLEYALGPLGQIYLLGDDSLTFDKQGFLWAQWGALLGLATFSFTFHAASLRLRGRFKPKPGAAIPRAPLDAWPPYILVTTVVVFGALLFVYRPAYLDDWQYTNEFVGIRTVFNFTAPLQQPMFFFLAYFAKQKGRLWFWLWLAVFVGYSGFWVLAGGRGAMAFAALFSALGWVYGGGRPWRAVLAGVVMLILLIPLSAVMLVYRQVADRSLQDRSAVFVAIARDFRLTDGFGHFDETLAPFVVAVTARFVDQVFVQTPDILPFSGWEGAGNIVYIFTPRIINANRPSLEEGNDLAVKYGAPDITGWYMPTVGAGYSRFGWPGVVALYAANTLTFALVFAIGWPRRDRWEWMAMNMVMIYQVGVIWASTLTSTFYFGLSVVPRTFLTLLAIRVGIDLLGLLVRGSGGSASRPRVASQASA